MLQDHDVKPSIWKEGFWPPHPDLANVDVSDFAGSLCFRQVAGLEAFNAQMTRSHIQAIILHQVTTNILDPPHPAWSDTAECAGFLVTVSLIFDRRKPNDSAAYCHKTLIGEIYA